MHKIKSNLAIGVITFLESQDITAAHCTDCTTINDLMPLFRDSVSYGIPAVRDFRRECNDRMFISCQTTPDNATNIVSTLQTWLEEYDMQYLVKCVSLPSEKVQLAGLVLGSGIDPSYEVQIISVAAGNNCDRFLRNLTAYSNADISVLTRKDPRKLELTIDLADIHVTQRRDVADIVKAARRSNVAIDTTIVGNVITLAPAAASVEDFALHLSREIAKELT